jgi:hypothetical protein
LKTLETGSVPKENEKDADLIIRINKNPNYLFNELLNSYQTEDWERFEKLVRYSFAYLINFHVSRFYEDKIGKPIPDGFGFCVNEKGMIDTAVVIDSKSLRSKIKNKVSINFYEGEKYREYIDYLNKLQKTFSFKNKILIFIAPKFNESQIKKLSENIKKYSEFQDYEICFMNLFSLVTLLKIKAVFTLEREIRLRTAFDELIFSIFNRNSYMKYLKKKEKILLELGNYNAYMIRLNDLCEWIKEYQKHFADRKIIFEEFKNLVSRIIES